jgi:predicted enzyme related to lactoylglutathione lyase
MLPSMALAIRFMSIPSGDVLTLAKFWEKALGQQARGTATGVFIPFGDAEESPGVLIEESSETTRKTGIALTPTSGTLPREIARLQGLGARIVGKQHRGRGLGEVILADPEGNEFQMVSGVEDLRAFEEGDGQESADFSFWGDAEQAPDRSTTGGTYASVRAAGTQSQ